MKKQYDLAVYIGRFQPFHLGHLHVLEQCNRIADQTLVLVGSSFRPRSIKNPFLYADREDMIDAAADSINAPVTVRPLRDFVYRDDRWSVHVQNVVDQTILEVIGGPVEGLKVALVGHYKDCSSWYLKNFPQWDLVEVENLDGINATTIRDRMLHTPCKFNAWRNSGTAKLMPESTLNWMGTVVDDVSFLVDNLLSEVRDEYQFVQNYKKSWESAPYAPTFVTTDAVVIQQGHILLVRRGANPGKGQLALPGGFVNQAETLKSAVIRKLREETRLKVPVPVLLGSIVNERTFDAPDRSSRGRTITTAFHIHLSHGAGPLPEVRGSTDAAEAFWVPLNDVHSEDMFEDHYDIIDYFVPLVRY